MDLTFRSEHHVLVATKEVFWRTLTANRPQAGRMCEGVIRDHLDVGRPDQIALIFRRRVKTLIEVPILGQKILQHRFLKTFKNSGDRRRPSSEQVQKLAAPASIGQRSLFLHRAGKAEINTVASERQETAALSLAQKCVCYPPQDIG